MHAQLSVHSSFLPTAEKPWCGCLGWAQEERDFLVTTQEAAHSAHANTNAHALSDTSLVKCWYTVPIIPQAVFVKCLRRQVMWHLPEVCGVQACELWIYRRQLSAWQHTQSGAAVPPTQAHKYAACTYGNMHTHLSTENRTKPPQLVFHSTKKKIGQPVFFPNPFSVYVIISLEERKD